MYKELFELAKKYRNEYGVPFYDSFEKACMNLEYLKLIQYDI